MAWYSNVVQFLRRRVIRSVVAYDQVFLVERDLGLPIEERPLDLPIEFRLATADDIDSLTEELRYTEAGLHRTRRRLDEGHMCVVAAHQGRIISVSWMAVGLRGFECLGTKLSLGPGWAYVYHVRTLATYRSMGLQQALGAHRMTMAKEAGAIRTIAWIDTKNAPSLRFATRVGTQTIGTIWSVQFLRLWRYTSVPKRLKAYLAGEADTPA